MVSISTAVESDPAANGVTQGPPAGNTLRVQYLTKSIQAYMPTCREILGSLSATLTLMKTQMKRQMISSSLLSSLRSSLSPMSSL